ncbi:MAG: hypothetical protein ACR2JB_18250 [Bryobacteraceae bacterium]
MFQFVWEAEFDHSLKEIEPCPYCADRLMRRIEHHCSKHVECGSRGYGLVRCSWRLQKLLTWYIAAVDLTITVLDLKRDLGMSHSVHRKVALSGSAF